MHQEPEKVMEQEKPQQHLPTTNGNCADPRIEINDVKPPQTPMITQEVSNSISQHSEPQQNSPISVPIPPQLASSPNQTVHHHQQNNMPPHIPPNHVSSHIPPNHPIPAHGAPPHPGSPAHPGAPPHPGASGQPMMPPSQVPYQQYPPGSPQSVPLPPRPPHPAYGYPQQQGYHQPYPQYPPHPYYHQPYGQFPPHLGRPHPYSHGGPPDGQHIPTGPDDHGPRMYGGMGDPDRPPNDMDNPLNQSSDSQDDKGTYEKYNFGE